MLIYYDKIIIHQHYDLVSKYYLGGSHIPEYIWRNNKSIVIYYQEKKYFAPRYITELKDVVLYYRQVTVINNE